MVIIVQTDCPAQLATGLVEGQPFGTVLGDDQDVLAGDEVGLVTAKKFTHLSLYPVSHHRITKTAGGCNPEAGAAGLSRSCHDHEMRGMPTPALPLKNHKLTAD